MENFHCEPDKRVLGECLVGYIATPMRITFRVRIGDELPIDGVRLVRQGENYNIEIKSNGAWGKVYDYPGARATSKYGNPIRMYTKMVEDLKSKDSWVHVDETVPLAEECKVLLTLAQLQE